MRRVFGHVKYEALVVLFNESIPVRNAKTWLHAADLGIDGGNRMMWAFHQDVLDGARDDGWAGAAESLRFEPSRVVSTSCCRTLPRPLPTLSGASQATRAISTAAMFKVAKTPSCSSPPGKDLDAVKAHFGEDWQSSYLPSGYEELIDACSVRHVDLGAGWHVQDLSS